MVLVTITWIIFGLLSLIKILSSLNKGFKQNFCSLILNFLSFIISFMFARLLINSKIADLVGNKYMEINKKIKILIKNKKIFFMTIN